MATMNVSLPDAMKRWVEEQASGEQFSNSSEYVRDLIRKDQDKNAKIAEFQTFVNEGVESGISNLSVSDIWNSVVAQQRKTRNVG